MCYLGPLSIRLSVLLAQSDRFSDLGGRFRQSGPSLTGAQVVVFLVLIAAAMIAVLGIVRWHASRSNNGREDFPQLFRQLCRLYQINWTGKRLLVQLARLQGVAHPAFLFLMPERFEAAAIPVEMQAHASRVQQLQRQIFADETRGIDDSFATTGK
jgi:hypothetical protein